MLELPPEVQLDVLKFLRATDILAFARTCQKARALATPDNVSLWRCAFLHDFDDPAERLAQELRFHDANDERQLVKGGVDWYMLLKRRLQVFKALANHEFNSEDLTHDIIAETILDVLDTASGERTETSPKLSLISSRNMSWIDNSSDRSFEKGCNLFIAGYQGSRAHEQDILSVLVPLPFHRHFTRSVARFDRPPRSDAISRLHVLFGLTKDEEHSRKSMAAARRLVYDMSLASPDTDYGPFHLDGSGKINWQLLEAITVVVGRNVRQCARGVIELPKGLSYALPYLTAIDENVPHDWAGVTGSWYGTYCFLDYQDLFHYNLGHRDGGGRPSLEGQIEACGDLMQLDLTLDATPRAVNDWRLRTTLPERTDPPPLFFSGLSMSHGDPSHPRIRVRGKVSLLPNGREVRWRYIIRCVRRSYSRRRLILNH